MSFMFYKNVEFNQPISSWNVSKVTTMIGMFAGDPSQLGAFNHPIGSWDVRQVTTMESMFYASSYNQPLAQWKNKVFNVENMKDMFCLSRFNQPLPDWNVSRVTDFENMFLGSSMCQDLSSWEPHISPDAYLDGMFQRIPEQCIPDWYFRLIDQDEDDDEDEDQEDEDEEDEDQDLSLIHI